MDRRFLKLLLQEVKKVVEEEEEEKERKKEGRKGMVMIGKSFGYSIPSLSLPA